ncbi:hypothetical protein ACJX0J_013352, partial [Zea mays]
TTRVAPELWVNAHAHTQPLPIRPILRVPRMLPGVAQPRKVFLGTSKFWLISYFYVAHQAQEITSLKADMGKCVLLSKRYDMIESLSSKTDVHKSLFNMPEYFILY